MTKNYFKPTRKLLSSKTYELRRKLILNVVGSLHIRRLRSGCIAICIGLLLISPLLLAAQKTVSPEVKIDLDKAQAALRAKDAVTAQRMFEAVLKMDSSNVEAQVNLGVIAFFHGDCAAAEPYFRGAIRDDPALTKMRALLSVCEARLGQPHAQADMQSAFTKLQDAKLRARLGIELANLDYQRGELEKASAVLQQLMDIQPNNVNYLFFAQRVYSELANQTLNKLAVLAPDSARMQQLIAERLINEGDAKDATAHYKKALQIDPRLPGVHFELAEALMQGNPEDPAVQAEAEAQLKDAMKIDGDSANLEWELGRILLMQSHVSQALVHYQRAYKMNPHSAEATMGLAEIMQRSGNDQEAAQYLRIAVQADPFNAKAHYRLSQLDKKLHRDAEAQKQLQLFLAVRSARDKVKQLYREMHPSPQSATPERR